MFCSKCGCENQEGAKFCQKCGTQLIQIQIPHSPVGNTMFQQDVPEKSNARPKKSNKKPFIIVSIVVVFVASIIALDLLFNIFVFCKECGKFEVDWDGRGYREFLCFSCYDAYYASSENDSDEMVLGEAEGYAENTYYENGESFEYSGETFSFYSTLNMHLNYRDSDEGCYFYEWEEEDSNVEIEVEIYNTLDGYNSSEFETLLQKSYIADSKDDTTYDTEKGVLKNGLPMTAVWQKKAEHDYYLEISTYTDTYYYEFQIFSYDESYLIELYNSISNCVIE